MDYVTDKIIWQWPVFTVLLSSRLWPIYLAALTFLNIIGLFRGRRDHGQGTEETLAKLGITGPRSLACTDITVLRLKVDKTILSK